MDVVSQHYHIELTRKGANYSGRCPFHNERTPSFIVSPHRNTYHCFGKISKRQDELIYAWMEKHGICMTETNWNTIAKRYQRQRNIYLHRQRAKCSYQRKKST